MRKQILNAVAAPFRKYGRLENLLKVTRLRGKAPGATHQVVLPHATYSPWWGDEAFLEILERVKRHTLVDIYRLYELWSLVGQVRDVDGDFLEVGVWRGGSGCMIAAAARREGLDATVYLCDTFKGVVKAGPSDNRYRGGEHDDTTPEVVEEIVRDLALENVRILQGIFPDDTAAQVDSRQFRFCHVDVDTYESARDVVDWLWPVLSPGGVVVFDDYGFFHCEGVTRLVNELGERSDLLRLHNLNGHAVLVKR